MVYCLYLPERRESAEKEFKKWSVPVTFIEGLDARLDITANHLRGLGDGKMGPGEVACALGHLTIWERIVGMDHDWSLVFEDDVTFARPPLDAFHEARRLCPEAGVILLNDPSIYREYRPPKEREVRPRWSYAKKPYWGTTGYAISREAAKECMERQAELRYRADCVWRGDFSLPVAHGEPVSAAVRSRRDQSIIDSVKHRKRFRRGRRK